MNQSLTLLKEHVLTKISGVPQYYLMCSYVENGFLWAQEADFSDKEAWHTGSPGPNILISSKISYTKIDHVNRKVDV